MGNVKTMQISKLRNIDVLKLGWHGLRAHPARATLSALGVAIGIAAMVAVIGLSMSSQASVQQQLAALGTNLLTVTPGESFTNDEAKLPEDAAARAGRIDGVEQVSWIADLQGVHAYRNGFISEGETNGLTVRAADQRLLEATSTTVRQGSWLDSATQRYPTAVLGATAAQRLGMTQSGAQLNIGGVQHSVIGILAPSALAPELNTSVLVGDTNAREQFGFSGAPTTLFERSHDDVVDEVRTLLPSTLNPQHPNEVSVSRPSDGLAAQHAIDTVFTGLLVGVGSIALLVGGIGVANIMVITVMERRRDIGLRRALGATRAHIRRQFLVEAVLLAAYGGVAGAALGAGCTVVVAWINGWIPTMPLWVPAVGILVTIVVGAIAGVLPALKAAAMSPTAALAA